ncbi:MAG TPA: hypothetical protein VJP80_07255 [Candidatus Saccharimonadales bacterium]|nr:hypothetical protein [Candidatus Saccharimonadales bacterium]
MPDAPDVESENDSQTRSRHDPEHASAKHERTADSKKPAADTDTPSEDAVPFETSDTHVTAPTSAPKSGAHHGMWQWVARHKKVSVLAAALFVLVVLAVTPYTRYMLAGVVLSRNVTVSVTDSQTGKPITSATVSLDGKKVATDSTGKVVVHAHVGYRKVVLSKTYYRSASQRVLVPLGNQKQPYSIRLVATGRQVPISVVDVIGGKPVENALFAAAGTQVKTDAKGQATIVVPTSASSFAAVISSSGYNTRKATLKVTTSADPANTFQVTPAGKLYFLSNASGKLDVVKSDLDGQNRQTVLPGTGSEDNANTVLLASRDWKFIALLSRRDGGDNAKLFLIDTSNDQLTTMDEGDASFAPQGWSGHHFIYTVTRNNVDTFQSKHQALKSYDADAKKIILLDETTASTTPYQTAESYGSVYILDKEVVFIKNQQSATFMAVTLDKPATLNSIQADGSQKKVVKSYSNTSGAIDLYLDSHTADFGEIYIRYPVTTSTFQHDAYKDGKLTSETLTDDQYFNGTYFTYIVSPSGGKTLWSDYRDGKNVFLVGDASGGNGKQLGGSTDTYAAYGWYSDDYVLVTKDNSELYIIPADGDLTHAVKVTDYYKPTYLIRGYGYGYGG